MRALQHNWTMTFCLTVSMVGHIVQVPPPRLVNAILSRLGTNIAGTSERCDGSETLPNAVSGRSNIPPGPRVRSAEEEFIVGFCGNNENSYGSTECETDILPTAAEAEHVGRIGNVSPVLSGPPGTSSTLPYLEPVFQSWQSLWSFIATTGTTRFNRNQFDSVKHLLRSRHVLQCGAAKQVTVLVEYSSAYYSRFAQKSITTFEVHRTHSLKFHLDLDIDRE